MTGSIILSMLFNLVGGLGIFLIGMKYMQQGLQVVSGPRIRQLINAFTSNRFMAVGTGTLLTMLVQSSSVTSVMVIGLVNSELMSLTGALGAIMGANIGTTITGWILALKIGKYGLPILGVAAFFWLFVKNEKIRYSFLAILGIGMIFFGLELMKDGFKPLSGHEDFKTWFTIFEASSYFGVLKAAAVGCILTMIVQSSSATLGITIALASTGVIDFYTAGALVLGENIGTTITAYLASLGVDNMNAKRVAYYHCIFNVSGVLWITAIFLPIYMPAIVKGYQFFLGVDLGYVAADGSYPNVTSGIATVHSIFNILNTLLFIWLLTPIANLLMRIGRGKAPAPSKFLTHLDFPVSNSSPLSAIERSRHEIERMDTHSRQMLDNLRKFVTNGNGEAERREISEAIFERERIFDKVQIEITEFLTELLAQDIGTQITEEARAQLRLTDEYESVSDYVTNVLKLYLRLEEHQEKLTEEQQQELLELHDLISDYFNMVHEHFTADEHSDAFLKIIHESSFKITERIRELRELHWVRLSKHSFTPLVSTSYMDIANAYRRIKDHLLNIGEALEGGKTLKAEEEIND